MDRREFSQAYVELTHAMQAGVAFKMEHDGSEVSGKQLRVGVNGAMRDHGSLVKLLLDKGIIGEEEYMEAIIEGLKQEVEGYERWAEEHTGAKVTFA